MTPNLWFVFVIGLLIGWLIEWVIDWIYWRRKCKELELKLLEVKKAVWKDDDLQQIRGIGPVIERKLNDAGIFTIPQLAQLTVVQLTQIIGEEIQRLADEEDILRQARKLAHRK